MKRWRLGICDREAGYARSLARFLRARGEGRLEVRVFTAKAAAAACLDEGGLDCLLADEECAAQWVSYPGVFVAALSEKDGDGEVPFVGKYQSAERIWKRLLEIGAAGDWEQPSSVGSRKTEIIGICSPSQDLKGLVLGLLAGRLLSGTERSLFLTIGEFSALPELLGGGGEGELSELYYCCCQGRLSGGQLRAAACRWGTADWIAPPERPEDLYRNGRPYEADFFRSLMQTGGYGFLVLELGGADDVRMCMVAAAIRAIGGTLYGIAKEKYAAISLQNNVILYHEARLRISAQAATVFNGLVLSMAVGKKFLEGIITWMKERRSTALWKRRRRSSQA